MITGIRLLVILMFILGGLYPFSIFFINYAIVPFKTTGSIYYVDNEPIGSRFIAQRFQSDRYFWNRPSAVDYNASASGGSQLSIGSGDWIDIIEARRQFLIQHHSFEPQSPSENRESVPDDLIMASGSGLDPHITPDAARYQIQRVIRARQLDEDQQQRLLQLVDRYTRPPAFGVFGHWRVAVLDLNLALDRELSDGQQTR